MKSLLLFNEVDKIFVLTNGLTKSNKIKLQRLANFHHTDLEIFNIKTSGPEILSDLKMHLYKLSLHKFIEINEYILYLDTDTIITGKLTDLFNTDIKSFPIAAVPQFMASKYKDKIGMRNKSLYFNSGVLLINYKYDLTKEIFDVILFDKAPIIGSRYVDQDKLNLAFENNFFILEKKYNTIVEFETKTNYLVLHYAGKKNKPLECNRKMNYKYHNEFKKFLRLSGQYIFGYYEIMHITKNICCIFIIRGSNMIKKIKFFLFKNKSDI